jgi:hypothetical protein
MNLLNEEIKMKKFNTIALILLFLVHSSAAFCGTKRSKVVEKSSGSITFLVDEGLPSPEHHLGVHSAARVTWNAMTSFGFSATDVEENIVDKSFNDSLCYMGSSTMFRFFTDAYAHHRPIVLTPDDVWLLITQGVAQHINRNAESLRDKLVYHKDKMTLVVKTDQYLLGKDDYGVDPSRVKPVDWTLIFDEFVKQMKENTKGEIVSQLCADFSTTTVNSRIASQITIMNALQPYFDYVVQRVSCGIPSVTLKGTPEDWQKVLDRAKILGQYDLDWWTEKLIPVLEEFVLASKGKPNKEFWRCMVMKIRPDEIRGGGCSPFPSTMFDGWFLTFFPYDRHGRTPEKISRDHDMAKDLLYADFKYQVVDPMGRVQKETPMQFYSGFVGVDEDTTTYAITPRIGWLVRKGESAKED